MTTHSPALDIDRRVEVPAGRNEPRPVRPDDPWWARPVLGLLLVGTAVTYLWNLSASGWGNTYYAAAAQAGTQSWTAWLFGALDAPGAITVDKPPAALWIMGLSARLFGFSSWSVLAPQALMGVAAVALTHATVRRWAGPRTALAAAAILAATPVAVLMFRFDNPDALLTLCLVTAAYTTVRAVDAAGTPAGTAWSAAVGALLGLGFLTKMLQVGLVVPALALTYLLVAAPPTRRTIRELAAAVIALDVSAGWYLVLVGSTPPGTRPYIGGSLTDSVTELALGYNGLGRVLGDLTGTVPSGGAGTLGYAGFGGAPGPARMVTPEFAGQIAWLLPAALVLLAAALWARRRAPRTDRTRGLLVLGGVWTMVHVAVFSAMSGTIHPYYTVALAPGLAITVATGAAVLWRRRERPSARLVLAACSAGSGAWCAVVLTGQAWGAGLRGPVVVAGLLGAAGLLAAGDVRLPGSRAGPLRRASAVLAVAAALAAPLAFAAVTVTVPHGGSMPTSGPVGTWESYDDGVDPVLADLLRSSGTTWSAATIGAKVSAPLALASGTPVLTVGGFDGTDPSPSLAWFRGQVAQGRIRWFVAAPLPTGRRVAHSPVTDVSGEISGWVAGRFPALRVGGRTVYDLAHPHG